MRPLDVALYVCAHAFVAALLLLWLTDVSTDLILAISLIGLGSTLCLIIWGHVHIARVLRGLRRADHP